MRVYKFASLPLFEGDKIYFDENKEAVYDIEAVKRYYLIVSRNGKKVKVVDTAANDGLTLSHRYLLWQMPTISEAPTIFAGGINKITRISNYE